MVDAGFTSAHRPAPYPPRPTRPALAEVSDHDTNEHVKLPVMVAEPLASAPAQGASRGATLPSTAQGRRTRAAIVEAAAALIYQRGVAASTLDDILAASGTGKSQLYHYFDDKADLVVAVISRQIELILQAQPLIFKVESVQGIQDWADGIVAVHASQGGPFSCPLGTMAAELKNDPAYLPALSNAFAKWQKPLHDGLVRMRDRGSLSLDDDPGRLAAMLIGALQGGMLLARVAEDVTALRDTLQSAVEDIGRRVERTTSAGRG
jgi:TetR/AcrR family transcriptional regulator, transcriptional repressor for nem operon